MQVGKNLIKKMPLQASSEHPCSWQVTKGLFSKAGKFILAGGLVIVVNQPVM